MLYIKKLLIGLTSLLSFTQAKAKITPAGTFRESLGQKSGSFFNDTTLGRVIVITKVEKPSAASYNAVKDKFIESIPQYKQIP